MSKLDKINTKELDKLEQYLKDKSIPYIRIDQDEDEVTSLNRHQIMVFDSEDMTTRLWDAICQKYSYGYEQGLLEIMGKPVVKDEDMDTVVGYLTAEDVIKRLEDN